MRTFFHVVVKMNHLIQLLAYLTFRVLHVLMPESILVLKTCLRNANALFAHSMQSAAYYDCTLIAFIKLFQVPLCTGGVLEGSQQVQSRPCVDEPHLRGCWPSS